MRSMSWLVISREGRERDKVEGDGGGWVCLLSSGLSVSKTKPDSSNACIKLNTNAAHIEQILLV